ncbi:MAG: DUF4492 domain-containing protein [Desulfobacula sp.]|jgi:uncharacterized membrane protein|uniref:DUF4492 domain-containing protein n=1 Tax=Desulfobacula sp. TaxID=2593537 RepID=UPI001D2451AA|nr:DUF4492 domain-containing protein [Desulfobacula sp.]MBT3484745.1 DUF4492 domain-containing protein [Desulfobacula sp.]MBT3804375.1 DUF4492 domain-containing protein [Desulfobacula sp.]MBT4025166.1 DUF4492 domain-containing protein [Desulfobacula sp.]MBT4198568.1 DUF4492 domain-containing protein [Desulfobacula sp.]
MTFKNYTTPIKSIHTIYTFYRDGFRGMVLGKKLWTIILIKLFVMFVVLKLFFFPNYLNKNFQTDEEKGNFVLEQITANASKSQSK